MSGTGATVTYWAGRGRAEPLRNLLAAGGLPFENVCLTEANGVAQLADMRASGKLAYDRLPLVEIAGMNLVENFPTAMVIAQQGGLWPAAPADAYAASHVWAACQDARMPLVQFPFHLDKTRVEEEVSGPKGLLGRYLPKWEAQLAAIEGPFFLASPSLADVGVFECLDFLGDVIGAGPLQEALAPFPRVAVNHRAASALGALGQWCEVDRPKLFLPWDQYAASVRTTLEAPINP